MKLAPHETATPLWHKLSEHYKAELAKHRGRLENPSLTEKERDALCWRIHEIKNLLDLAEPDRKKVTDAG
jgi:hypothetical protein